ncbi:hypothetical protein UlMin_023389 [Ulmus minor]
MAEKESILNLFDSYWFGHAIQTLDQNPSPQVQQKLVPSSSSSSSILNLRSLSDQTLLDSKTSIFSSSFPPMSVLATPKLQPIFSGKEVKEFSGKESEEGNKEVEIKMKIKKKVIREKRRKKNKSLSDLEFEELKGFMDLGFVFTEEETKDSELVSIIPALQRLGKKGGDEDKERRKGEKIEGNSVISRPYLSEAWDVLEQRKREKPLMNWRIPASGNKIDMKDHLRFWAHTVASTVR